MRQNTGIPDPLDSYLRDDAPARHYRRGSLLGFGWIFLLLLASLLALFVWHNRALGLGFAILSIVGLARYIYRQQKKNHRIRCSSCGEPMAVVDMPFPEKKLSPAMDAPDRDFSTLFLVSFLGADGYVYQISSGGDSDVFHFYRLVERYYACHTCKVCFLAEERVSLPVADVSGQVEAAEMKERIRQQGLLEA